MGIRESLKDRSRIVLKGVGLLVVAAVVYAAVNSINGSSPPTSKAYYTTDDGATQFVAPIALVPPFDHYGKPAYRVWMFTTDGGKTMFAGYLERYTPEGKALLEAGIRDFKAGKIRVMPRGRPEDSEVKKPGPGNPWVSGADRDAVREIITPKVAPGQDVDVALPS